MKSILYRRLLSSQINFSLSFSSLFKGYLIYDDILKEPSDP